MEATLPTARTNTEAATVLAAEEAATPTSTTTTIGVAGDPPEATTRLELPLTLLDRVGQYCITCYYCFLYSAFHILYLFLGPVF